MILVEIDLLIIFCRILIFDNYLLAGVIQNIIWICTPSLTKIGEDYNVLMLADLLQCSLAFQHIYICKACRTSRIEQASTKVYFPHDYYMSVGISSKSELLKKWLNLPCVDMD